MDVGQFSDELETGIKVADDGDISLSREPYSWTWRHRFCTVKDSLVPDFVAPLRPDFTDLMGRRVCCPTTMGLMGLWA